MHNLLILGGSGFVGSALARDASRKYHVIATYNLLEPVPFANISWLNCRLPDDFPRLEHTIDRSSADVVIDCIALSNVEACELEPLRANLLNAELPRRLAGICHDIGVRLIYLSTEYVFDGIKGNYIESDTPRPINRYGETKLLGEKATLQFQQNLVIRTSLVYGWDKRCRFLNFVVDTLHASKAIGLFSDQMSCPTLVTDLTTGILRAAEIGLSGICHVVGPECVSRYEFGCAIARHWGLDVRLLTEAKSSHIKTLAKRPANSCLSNKKACSALGMTFADVDTGLVVVVDDSRKALSKTRSSGQFSASAEAF